MKRKSISLYEVAIVAYIFGILFFTEGNKAVNIFRVFLVGAGLLSLLKSPKLPIIWYEKWGVLFIAYGFMSSFWAYSSDTAVAFTMTVIYVFCCNVLILIYLCKKPLFIYQILKAIIWATITSGIMFYIKNLSAILAGSRIGGQTNAIGIESAFALCACLILIKKNQILPKRRMLYYVAMFVALVFLFMSGSRKALVILVISFSVYFITKSKNPARMLRNILITSFVIIILLVAVLKVPVLYSSIGYRLSTLIAGLQGLATDASTATRMKLVSDGIEMFKQKPWIGYGLANYSVYHSTISDISYYAHNNYIELLVDTGIIGLIIYYSLYIDMLVSGIKRIKKKESMSLLMLGYLVATIISEYGMVTYYGSYEQLINAVMWFILSCKYGELVRQED